ncbi:MAG: cobalamin-binding protein [Planctomycetaceae bacterium]|jgi:iron complex transport system substrate-binding protein|nr:cobalamin-binding protein [Planctomycetaceae bacterium]MDG2388475.1 cobalamin-binding protein [Planctomycetaceae bacterium]
MTKHRIISLIPSATEIVCALGQREQLVGRSHECDVPADVASLPICCQPTIDINATSAEINRQVSQRLQDAVSIFKVDRPLLADLEPTVIITQTQCDVCAVDLSEVEKTLCETLPTNPQLVACEPHALKNIYDDIRKIGEAIGANRQAFELVLQLETRLMSLHKKTSLREDRPRVVCIEWIEPPMAAGNWVPELVEIAGGMNLFGSAGQHSPWLDWNVFLESDPDVIIIVPCGFEIERTKIELEPLLSRPGWQNLSAVKNKRVAIADGHNFFNRPGPRVVDSAEIIAEILHPGEIDCGHRGTGWIPLENLVRM